MQERVVLIVFTLVLFIGSTLQGNSINAARCFECSGVPYPRDCAKIATCAVNERCFTEQIVTSSGHIVYNSGCLSDNRCNGFPSAILGRRNANLTNRRSTDISTCMECCEGSFCNDEGCGTQRIPASQRGPYCYSCDSLLDPTSCDSVFVCQTNEQCMLFSPPEFQGVPETVYRSQCETNAGCDALSQAFSNRRCPPMCCDTDFCNDHCGTRSNTSMSTPFPHTTLHPESTKPTNQVTTHHVEVSTQGTRCKSNHYFDEITGMCIYIEETQKLNYTNAKRACEAIGDSLVTIDMHEKTVFVENTIIYHSRLTHPADRTYYIGLYDKHDTSTFYWSNGHQVVYTNWGGGDKDAPIKQPDDGPGKHQDCVILYGPDHYRWHDDHCTNSQYVICEDVTFLKQTDHIPGATDPTGSSNIHSGSSLSPDVGTSHNPHYSGTSKSKCEHGGYIYLQNNSVHLCVRIVTAHPRAWVNARHQCLLENGDLVVLDSHEKAVLMKHKLNDEEFFRQQGYWIGAKDFQENDIFSWINGSLVVGSSADWDNGQPTHQFGEHHNNCVCMSKLSREHFQWHAEYCVKSFAFICEHSVN